MKDAFGVVSKIAMRRVYWGGSRKSLKRLMNGTYAPTEAPGGVWTTPHRDLAAQFATRGGKNKKGALAAFNALGVRPVRSGPHGPFKENLYIQRELGKPVAWEGTSPKKEAVRAAQDGDRSLARSHVRTLRKERP